MTQTTEEKKRKILIIDDSDVDRILLSQVLTKKGFEVIALSSGENCLEILEKEKPAVLLLDVMMPKIPGNQVLQNVREKYSSIQLPVIMITSKSDSSDIVKSFHLGANDHITKPVDFEIALMRIYTHIKIVDLSQEMSRLKELETVSAMIITYNHEINNPLAVAIASTAALAKKFTDEKGFRRIEEALWRVADIVKKIQGIPTQQANEALQYDQYTEGSHKLRLK